MQKLYDVLCNGYVSTGSQRRRIDGDTTQLPFADGLTEEERRIAQKVNYLANHMPGNPMTRRVMGQVQFGARIIYGDCVFMTVSLNEQHSALVLRMMRGRRADPMLGTKTMQENNAAKWLMVDVPNLEEMETAEVEIPVPAASVRAQLAAQNPHAVMSAFQLEVRARLAQLLGLRMCFRCPDCRCRDRFGSNMLPCGGVFGAAVACGGAVEFQYHSSPYFHFEVFLANIYQYHTLNDIRKRIEAKLFDPQEVFKWYEWVKMEASPDLSEFSQDADHLREEWWDRFQNREHDRLYMLPRMLAGPSDGIVWGTNTLQAQLEGEEFRKQYLREVQWVYSRVQEHVHHRTSDGWKPLASCRSKRNPCKCKHDFPVSPKYRNCSRLVCPGNAKKLGMSIRGKRNGLGRILVPRTGEWTNGTHPALAIVHRFNTDTKPNYHLPVCASVHDTELCTEKCISDPDLGKRIACKAMKAGRLATGYFTGYIFKIQPANKNAAQAAARALLYAASSFEGKTARQQMQRTIVRTMSDFYFQTASGRRI